MPRERMRGIACVAAQPRAPNTGHWRSRSAPNEGRLALLTGGLGWRTRGIILISWRPAERRRRPECAPACVSSCWSCLRTRPLACDSSRSQAPRLQRSGFELEVPSSGFRA
eukprot:13871633-Alexandrium_andersonii.AAC.1